MKHWIIPSNGRVFDLEGALAANQGLLDWRLKNVSVGDIVYIYKTRPDSCIKYMMEVAETDGETARPALSMSSNLICTPSANSGSTASKAVSNPRWNVSPKRYSSSGINKK